MATHAVSTLSPGHRLGRQGDLALPWAEPFSTYRHQALMWGTHEDFLAAAVPFVAAGVAAGQPVMVAMTPGLLDLLAEALGAAGNGVTYVDMTVLGHNPARIIPAWTDFVQDAGGPVRGIGEPIWAGRPCAELAESQLHEALLNVAVDAAAPLWLLCPYQVADLRPAVVDEAWRSHPQVISECGVEDSPVYGGAEHVRELFGAPLPPPPGGLPVRSFGASDLSVLRHEVSQHGQAAGLGVYGAENLALAVHEIAANSVEHAGGGGDLRLWTEHETVLAEVRDGGVIEDVMVGRREVGKDADCGRGVWLANQLCDLVQIRSGPSGTTVRVYAKVA